MAHTFIHTYLKGPNAFDVHLELILGQTFETENQERTGIERGAQTNGQKLILLPDEHSSSVK